MKKRSWLWLSSTLTMLMLISALAVGPLYADVISTDEVINVPMIVLEPEDGGY